MAKREKGEWANQLVSVIKAIRMLSRPGGASNEELCEELGVGIRTVQRIKKTLQSRELLNLPMFEGGLSPEGHQRMHIPNTGTLILPRLDKIGLNMPELMALYILRGVAGIYKGSSIMEDIDSAFEKIGALISPQSRAMLERYSRLFVVAPKSAKNYAASDEVIDEIASCILDQKVCQITYHAFVDGTIKEYPVNPLHFFEHVGGLYLLAEITKYSALRTLAVERISKAEMTDEPYIYPKHFDPEQFLSSAFTLYFGEPESFRIRFSKDQARYIAERQWAASQQIVEQADGSIILTMETSGGYDIKKWVLSYGADAELLEPAWLREEIIEELQQGMNHYSNKCARS